ncbi:MAG: UpxY family transcription antiterminator [Bacteroidetes bacterium]|nr:UpxY family transcription antiterminator [Bacteroidota bacterium]
MPWYVLHTKPRNEKKITTLLQNKGFKVYCPLREEIRQWSDRKKKVAEPVFKSYVFVFLDDYKEENTKVLVTNGAVRFLWWVGKPGVVREEEILAIQDFLENYKNADITVEYKIGETVEVKEGPLKETKGKLVQVRGNIAKIHIKTLGVWMIAKLPVQSIAPAK